MDFFSHKSDFDTYIGVKSVPSEHETILMARAEKYIQKITWIPGLRMVAVVNSLSMYATHQGSDIDLFIITAKNRMWLVRVLITLTFSLLWVWRKWADIAGNFCLSFFIEESAMDISKIAIEDDIYLYFWMYYMRPIYTVGDTYERFIQANPGYTFLHTVSPSVPSSSENSGFFWTSVDQLFRYLLESFTQKNYEKKWRPAWVIISDDMLKFHDADRRLYIRESLLSR